MRWQGLNGFRRDEKGSIAMIFAVGLMVAIVGIASLAVDMGHLYSVRSELQNTTDAAAQAAVMGLIQQDVNGVVFKDADGAVTQAMGTINTAGTALGLASINDSDPGLSINFGYWDDKALTWTLIGNKTNVTTNSTANAVEITLQRGNTGTYGPVANFFGGIFGLGASTVKAKSRAYMSSILGVPLGTVPIPVAVPVNGPNSPLYSESKPASSWYARLFGPSDAVAQTATWKTFYFKDTGGNNVNTSLSNNPTPDGETGYWFVCNPNDSVPNTILRILQEAALSTHTNQNSSTSLTTTGRTIYFVDALKYGQEIFARSEYKYYASPYYLQNPFKYLKAAYDAKKNASGIWRVTLPLYSGTQYPLSASRRLDKAFRFLAWMMGPTEANACYSFAVPPHIYVNGFVNVDITNVTFTDVSPSTVHCNQCNYTYPKTIDGVTYANKKDCLARLAASCWNSNVATMRNVTNLSTVIPNIPLNTPNSQITNSSLTNNNAAGYPGGATYKQLNANAMTGVTAYGNIPKLIPVN
jgi:Flp pilus assembly protein TadG